MARISMIRPGAGWTPRALATLLGLSAGLDLVALGSAPGDDAEQGPDADQAMPAYPGSIPDPTQGGDTAQTAGDTSQDLSTRADEIQGLISGLDAPDASADTLYHQVITANADAMADTQDARTSLGEPEPGGATLVSGSGRLTIGAEVTDIDYPGSYPTSPSRVHFITDQKNQLASLNDRMGRAAHWANKHTCGGFDWAAQFDFLFKAQILREYLTNLGEGVIAAAPMALLGAFSPQLAEIVKHLKLIAGMDLSASKMDCQAIQNALTTGVQKQMWGDSYSQCLSNNQNSGLDQAVQSCQDTSTQQSVELPDGDSMQTVSSQTAAQSTSSWSGDEQSVSHSYIDSVFGGGSGSDDAGDAIGSGDAAAASSGTFSGDSQAAAQGVSDAASSDPSVVGMLGNDLGGATQELAETLWGSVRFQGTGALELGRKSFQLFDTTLKTHAARLRDQIQAQLLDHYALITAPVPDAASLHQSYQYLKLWTWQSRGADQGVQPWLNSFYTAGLLPTLPSGVARERITDHTMDCCAYLLNLSVTAAANPGVHYTINRVYDIDAWVTALSQLECYLFVYRDLFDKYQELLELTRDLPASETDIQPMADAARAQFSESMTACQQALLDRMQVVLSHLTEINDFRPPTFSAQPPVTGIGSGPFPQPEVRFGAQNPND